mmetsp:Transcript_6557/g.10441  ORF Transcript_6557/g.10441 Transcript_6557/m.10441 type:complete len:217 (-) Transcript_6557:31-681(-)
MGDSITTIQHTPRGTTGSIQGKHSLNVNIHGRDIECLEHDLGHALPVGLGVLGGFRQKDGVGLGRNAQLVVEGVVPDFLHVIPVGDNSVLDGVFKGEDSTLGLGFVTDVGVSLFHTDHNSGLTGASNQRGEYGSWGIVSGESSFTHSRPIVNDKGGNFIFISHICGVLKVLWMSDVAESKKECGGEVDRMKAHKAVDLLPSSARWLVGSVEFLRRN